jgi:hypoxanthine phosphoribosyltransferase
MTWQDYSVLEASLATSICNESDRIGAKIDMVFGIFRGGIILARSLASILGEIPLVIVHLPKDPDASLETMANVDLVGMPDEERAQKVVLLVDDISDSGGTFIKTKQYLENMHFTTIITAALIYKTYSGFHPDLFGEADGTNTWIVFPWERKRDETA